MYTISGSCHLFFQYLLMFLICFLIIMPCMRMHCFCDTTQSWNRNINFRNMKKACLFFLFFNCPRRRWLTVNVIYNLRVLLIILITVFAIGILILKLYKILRPKSLETFLIAMINTNFLSYPTTIFKF